MQAVARYSGSGGGVPPGITFAESQVYTLDVWHLGRALSGQWMSRAWLVFRQAGRKIAIDFNAEGQGANCVTWNASCAGAVRGTATLASGNRTAIEVAQAAVTAMQALGVTGVVRVGARVTIAGATDLVIGPSMTIDEDQRGMYGRERVDYGGGTSTPPSYGAAVNGTVSTHIQSGGTSGRITGIYILSTQGTRVGPMRMGIAIGPAYSPSPGAFSSGLEGTAANNGALYYLALPEPMTMDSARDYWITFRTNLAANILVETRIFAAVPTGRGELGANESNVIDTTASADPTALIYSGVGQTYAPVANFNGAAYTAVGYTFELPNASGDYVGDGAGDTLNGFHGDFDTGTPSTFGPTVIDGITDTPRLRIPWSPCRIRRIEQGCAAISSTEDFGFALYDCSASNPAVYPFNVAPTLIATIGPINASPGPGYKGYDCDIELVGVTVLGMCSLGGNRDGTIPATTITIVFTAPGAQVAWLNGWVDARNAWDDMVVERGGLGVNAQYVTQPGGMPFGNPSATFPATFQLAPPAGGTADSTGSNHPRIRQRITHAGMVAS